MFGDRNQAFRRGSGRVTERLLLSGDILCPSQKHRLTLLGSGKVLRTPIPPIRHDGVRGSLHPVVISRKRPRKQRGIIRFANKVFDRDQKSLAVEGELHRGPKLTGGMHVPFFNRTGIGFIQRDKAMGNMYHAIQCVSGLFVQEREQSEQFLRLMLTFWGGAQRLNERLEGFQRRRKEQMKRA